MSTFQLRAFHPSERTAIIKHDGRFFAMQPPYAFEAGRTTLRAEVYLCFAFDRFRFVGKKFETFEALVAALNEEVKHPYNDEDMDASVGAATRLLQSMTSEDYKDYMHFVDEWMNEGVYELAYKLLNDLLDSPVVQRTPLFFGEVKERLKKVEKKYWVVSDASFAAACEQVQTSTVEELRLYHLETALRFLKHGDYEGAFRLLFAIEAARVVSSDPKLFSEVKELLRECEKQKKER